MPARHQPDRVTESLPSSPRGIAWGLAAALVVAAVGCAHAVDETFADGLRDASAPIGLVTNGVDASAPVVAANGADISSRVPGLTFDASADEAIDAGVVSASDDAGSAVVDDADAPTAPVATTAPTASNPSPAPTTPVNEVPTAAPTTPAPVDTTPPVATTAPTSTTPPSSAPPATDASLPDDASTADEPPAAAPPATSPPVTPAPTCAATACTNLCLPYFVSCCKADATCGCALLFPRGPCD
jgi:hypothetical protein